MDLVELEKHRETDSRHPWETTRIRIIADKIQRLLSNEWKEKTGIHILDFGSGDAYVIDQLSNRFPNIEFIGLDAYYTDEIQQRVHGSLKNKSKIHLYKGLEEIPANGTDIDLVLILDVLEHIEDDYHALKSICDKLHKSFYCIITVPAFQSLFCSHDVFLKHYRRYDNKQLNELTSSQQFETRELGYFFTSLYMARKLQVMLSGLTGRNREADGISSWNKGRLITGIFNFILWADYKLSVLFSHAGISLPGLSNIFIGYKKQTS